MIAQSIWTLLSNDMTSSGKQNKKKREAAIVSLSLLRFIFFSIDNPLFLSLSRFTGVCSTNCWKETGRLVFPVSCNILYVGAMTCY